MPSLNPLELITGIGGLGTQAVSIAALIQQMLAAQRFREDPLFADLSNMARGDLETARNLGGPFGAPRTGFGGLLGTFDDGRPVMPGEAVAEQLARMIEQDPGNAILANLGASQAALQAPQGAEFSDIMAGRAGEAFQAPDTSGVVQPLPSPVSNVLGRRDGPQPTPAPSGGPAPVQNLAGTTFTPTETTRLPRAVPAKPLDLGALGEGAVNFFDFITGRGGPAGSLAGPSGPLAGLFGVGTAGPTRTPSEIGGIGGRPNVTDIKSPPIGFDGRPVPIDPLTGLPQMQQGGFMPSDQIVKLHKGEMVIPPDGRLSGQQPTTTRAPLGTRTFDEAARPVAPEGSRPSAFFTRGDATRTAPQTTRDREAAAGQTRIGATLPPVVPNPATDQALLAQRQQQNQQSLLQQQAQLNQAGTQLAPQNLVNLAPQRTFTEEQLGLVRRPEDGGKLEGVPRIDPRFTEEQRALVRRPEDGGKLEGIARIDPNAPVVNPMQGFIDLFTQRAEAGGPFTADVLAGMRGQVSDEAAAALQAQQRGIAEDVGARGFGDSGVAERLAFDARLASAANVLGQNRAIAQEAAIVNDESVNQSLQNAAQSALGGLSVQQQQQELELARSLGYERLDLDTVLGTGQLSLGFDKLQEEKFRNSQNFINQNALTEAAIAQMTQNQRLDILDRFMNLVALGFRFEDDMYDRVRDLALLGAGMNVPAGGEG